MPEVRRIKVGIDYDGVVIRKARWLDFVRRGTKMFLPNMPGVVEGISVLNEQADVDNLGIRTVRPGLEWFRKGQTRRQIRRRGIPVESVTHTANSRTEKIVRLLLDAHSIPVDKHLSPGEKYTPSEEVKRVVLIDDSIAKMVAATQKLAEERPEYGELLQTFTLAAFNPKQPEKVKGFIIPGVIHVVAMQSWADVENMLDEVRTAK